MKVGLEKNWSYFKTFAEENKISLTYGEFLEGYQFVMTRCYGSKELPTSLVPFGDSMNHHHLNPTTHCFLDNNEEGTLINKKMKLNDSEAKKQRFFVIYAQKEIKKNEEVFNFFGKKGSDFLLLWYGFSYRMNKYDKVKVMYEDRNFEIKWKKLN